MKSGLHGPGRDAEGGRRLGDREIQVEGQHQDRPLIDRQSSQTTFDLVGHGEGRLMVRDMRTLIG
jgi:hypothetical protein